MLCNWFNFISECEYFIIVELIFLYKFLLVDKVIMSVLFFIIVGVFFSKVVNGWNKFCEFFVFICIVFSFDVVIIFIVMVIFWIFFMECIWLCIVWFDVYFMLKGINLLFVFIFDCIFYGDFIVFLFWVFMDEESVNFFVNCFVRCDLLWCVVFVVIVVI